MLRNAMQHSLQHVSMLLYVYISHYTFQILKTLTLEGNYSNMTLRGTQGSVITWEHHQNLGFLLVFFPVFNLIGAPNQFFQTTKILRKDVGHGRFHFLLLVLFPLSSQIFCIDPFKIGMSQPVERSPLQDARSMVTSDIVTYKIAGVPQNPCITLSLHILTLLYLDDSKICVCFNM